MAELQGIPSVVLTREGFHEVVAHAFAGLGFPDEAPLTILPTTVFLPSSDLEPLARKLDEVIAGLTAWQPTVKEKGLSLPGYSTVEGADPEALADNLNRLFLRNMWSDGLPVVPPTRRRVEWILKGTDLSPDLVIARVFPRGAIATVETIAICLAAAGGRPEYLPVVIAAVQALANPLFSLHRMNTTTCSSYPAVIVNGPAAKQVRLASRYGCLGPDPLHPAGASIGRAISLLFRAVGRAVAGIGTMAIYGGPPRYTNVVFAEDEEGLPANWNPLHVEQGYSRNSNTVTVYSISCATNVPGGEVGDHDSALATLNRAAGFMGVPNGHYWTGPYNPDGAAGFLLFARGTAQGLAKLGWSKEKVKGYLWENSKVPAHKLGPRIDAWWVPPEKIVQDPMPIAVSPRGIKVVVAGGLQSGHMMWLQVGCCAERPTSAEIKLPAAWDDLLERAERDLGPIPA